MYICYLLVCIIHILVYVGYCLYRSNMIQRDRTLTHDECCPCVPLSVGVTSEGACSIQGVATLTGHCAVCVGLGQWAGTGCGSDHTIIGGLQGLTGDSCRNKHSFLVHSTTENLYNITCMPNHSITQGTCKKSFIFTNFLPCTKNDSGNSVFHLNYLC